MKKLLLLTMLSLAACGPQEVDTCTAHGDCADGELCVDGACVAGPCSGVTCSGHGSCQAAGDAASCACDDGYQAQGLDCVSKSDPCSDVTCSGHGSCQVVDGAASCACDDGYQPEGLACVAESDPCSGVACSGHGSCRVVGGEPSCACEQGYLPQGLNCVADPCSGVTCSGHGTCRVASGAASCDCEEGFHADALSCVADGPAPVAAFELPAGTTTVQTEVTLDASASTGSGLAFRWDFEGDGAYDTEFAAAATLRHRWCAPATYAVGLQVRDSLGRTATATRSITVGWYGEQSWIGAASRRSGFGPEWSALDASGTRTSVTDLRADGSYVSNQEVHASRQASDGRVLTTLGCSASIGCGAHPGEISIVGPTGKTGVFATADAAPYDLLELPDCTWIVSFSEQGVILHADEQGRGLGTWATGLTTPAGLELTADGKSVLVALTDDARVERFSLKGVSQGRWSAVGSVASPFAVRRLASGNFAVTDLAGKLVELEADGGLAATLATTGLVDPRAVAELADGRLLVGASDGVKVYDPTDDSLGLFAPNSSATWTLGNVHSVVVVTE